MNEDKVLKFDEKTQGLLIELQKAINELLIRRNLIIQTFKNALELDNTWVLNPNFTGFTKIEEPANLVSNSGDSVNKSKEGGE